jgi:hypothetical protein
MTIRRARSGTARGPPPLLTLYIVCAISHSYTHTYTQMVQPPERNGVRRCPLLAGAAPRRDSSDRRNHNALMHNGLDYLLRKAPPAVKAAFAATYELLDACDAPSDVSLFNTCNPTEIALHDVVLFLRTRGAYLPVTARLLLPRQRRGPGAANDTSTDGAAPPRIAFTAGGWAFDQVGQPGAGRVHQQALEYIASYPGELLACLCVLPGHANTLLFHKPRDAPGRVRVFLFEPNGRVDFEGVQGRVMERAVAALGRGGAGVVGEAGRRYEFEFGGTLDIGDREMQGVESKIPDLHNQDPGGFCASWSRLFAELALMHWYRPPLHEGLDLRRVKANPVGELLKRVLAPFQELARALPGRPPVPAAGSRFSLPAAAAAAAAAARARVPRSLQHLLLRRAPTPPEDPPRKKHSFSYRRVAVLRKLVKDYAFSRRLQMCAYFWDAYLATLDDGCLGKGEEPPKGVGLQGAVRDTIFHLVDIAPPATGANGKGERRGEGGRCGDNGGAAVLRSAGRVLAPLRERYLGSSIDKRFAQGFLRWHVFGELLEHYRHMRGDAERDFDSHLARHASVLALQYGLHIVRMRPDKAGRPARTVVEPGGRAGLPLSNMYF